MDVITFPENLYTTRGLSILLHGVISLPDATSFDKIQTMTLNVDLGRHILQQIMYLLYMYL